MQDGFFAITTAILLTIIIVSSFAQANKITELEQELQLYQNYTEQLYNNCDSCQLCSKNASYGVGGVYYQDKYYCIWTHNRSAEEMYKDETHEGCHDLVYKDWSHFCE